jgi:hypothetical protein
MKWTRNLTAMVVIFGLSNFTALAQKSCKEFPYADGQLEIGDNEAFFVSTGGASVVFDDVDSVKDAREEATLEAKAAIAKFLTETITSDSEISKIVNESKKMSGSSKENVRTEAIRRTKSLRNSAQALLRGVQVIGSCYTPGAELRVTVGIKNETIAAAERLAGRIGSSVSRQPTSGSKTSGGQPTRSPGSAGQGERQPLTNVDGFSDASGIDAFKKRK